MVPQKFILALCCAAGVALPLAVSALPKAPTTPTSGGMPSTPGSGIPSTPGDGIPSTPGGLSVPKAQDLTTPGTGGGTTPAPTDAMPSSGTMPSDSTSPGASPSPSMSSPAPRSMKKSPKSTTTLVNVNTSTSQQLTQVKGIGAATAKKIIMYRPYTSLEELVTKKALTQKQLVDLKPQLTI
jgi:competence protein ComEA